MSGFIAMAALGLLVVGYGLLSVIANRPESKPKPKTKMYVEPNVEADVIATIARQNIDDAEEIELGEIEQADEDDDMAAYVNANRASRRRQ